MQEGNKEIENNKDKEEYKKEAYSMINLLDLKIESEKLKEIMAQSINSALKEDNGINYLLDLENQYCELLNKSVDNEQPTKEEEKEIKKICCSILVLQYLSEQKLPLDTKLTEEEIKIFKSVNRGNRKLYQDPKMRKEEVKKHVLSMNSILAALPRDKLLEFKKYNHSYLAEENKEVN